MIKNWLLVCVFILISCSLYEDTEQPDIYYTIGNFDVLQLGINASDMIMGPDNSNLYICDYNNNSLLKIDIRDKMKKSSSLTMGSHPIAMDIAPDQQTLAIAMEGESNIYIVNMDDFTVAARHSISLMNMNDIVFLNSNKLLVSSLTDPSVVEFNLADSSELNRSIINGELLINDADSAIFVASTSSIKKYDIADGNISLSEHVADPFGFSAMINHFTISPDRNTLFLCLTNPDDRTHVGSVYAYNTATLTFSGKYKINSPGMAVVVDSQNERVFIAPTNADKNGIFIVEFDAASKLEKNYFMAAGNLKEKCMVIDHDSQYLYVLIDTPGDNDSFEPYNSYSFDLQRIRIAE